MTKLSALIERFPAQELELYRLHQTSADFRGICADHAEALRALRHWQSVDGGDETKADEYRRLVEEIEGEIGRTLQASEQRKIDRYCTNGQ